MTTDVTTIEPTTADAAAALIASNRRRRSIRRWVAIGSIPFVLAGLLLSGKILSMYAFAHQSITSYIVGDYSGSTAAAEGQEFLNWYEPFKAPYNVGTSLAGSEELDAARAKLEESLTLAHGLEVCAVRVNLSIVVERMGDAALTDGDGPGAATLFGEALQITAETPEECSSEEAQNQSPDPDRSMGDTLDEQKDRQQEKQQQAEQQSSPPEDEGEEGEEPQPQQPDQEKLDELQEKLEQGAEERDQQPGDEDDGSGSLTEKPW